MKFFARITNTFKKIEKKEIKSKLSDKTYLSALSFLVATVIANFINFGFNAYLGRVLNFEDLALIGLFGSLLYFSFIPNSALGSTVNYRSSFLEGKFGDKVARYFWKSIRLKSIVFGAFATLAWIVISPLFMKSLRVDHYFPLLAFAPVVFFGLVSSVDRGFLNARFAFVFLAITAIFEPLMKTITAYGFVAAGYSSLAYLSIPLSVGLVAALISFYFFFDKNTHQVSSSARHFPKRFFGGSLLTHLSTISFLSLDIVLAKHFLPSEQAGQYVLLSLVGKMVYFLGSLGTQFLTPFASKKEGAGKDSKSVLYFSLVSSTLLSAVGLFAFGVFGNISVPLLFGQKAFVILPYVLPMCFAIFCFSISRAFAGYYLIKKSYVFPIVSMFMSALQLVLIELNHANVGSIVWAMVITGMTTLIVMTVLHKYAGRVKVIEDNVKDLFRVFATREELPATSKQNILVFNWRDTRHVWAGGAEVYNHEIMKRWVREGNNVTLFCGNDSQNKSDEIIDGVHILRRGGFYTVYLWAFVYYILRFRHRYDVIVDSVNGIPFFTPLYSTKKVIAIIPHVHQEVFRKHLKFPFSHFAMFLEARLMPIFYRSSQIVTVSNSSKEEITRLGFPEKNISIIHPGIEKNEVSDTKKNKTPIISYLGRLKPYKNVDIGVKAFKEVVSRHPQAKMIIAGEGESLSSLKALAKDLKIDKSVVFTGKVTEDLKAKIFSKSWVSFQLSQVEGWGITVIEANAYGTPVIASRVNGLKDSILDGKTGVLVPPKNVGATCDAMIDLIEDANYRRALAKNALAWAREFNWDDGAEVFGKILSEGKSRTYPARFVGNFAFAKKIISMLF